MRDAEIGRMPPQPRQADRGDLRGRRRILVPLTTCFNRSTSAVKFCEICRLPPKLTIAIRRSGPALASMNLPASCRARIWSPMSIDELSKNRTM